MKKFFDWLLSLFEVHHIKNEKKINRILIENCEKIREEFFYSWKPVEEGRFIQFSNNGIQVARFEETIEGEVHNITESDIEKVIEEMKKSLEIKKTKNLINDFYMIDSTFFIQLKDQCETGIRFLELRGGNKVDVYIYSETII